MEKPEEIIKHKTQSFEGNGDYFFQYVSPEDAAYAMRQYALDFCLDFQMWAKEHDWEICEVGAIAIPTFENLRTEEVLEYTELVEVYLKYLDNE